MCRPVLLSARNHARDIRASRAPKLAQQQGITLQSSWESAGTGRVSGSPCSGTAPRPIEHRTLHRVAQQTQLSIANRALERGQDSPETADHSHRATARVIGATSERADFGDASARIEKRLKTPSPSGVTPRPFGPRGVYLGKMIRANQFQSMLFTRYGERQPDRSVQRRSATPEGGRRSLPRSG